MRQSLFYFLFPFLIVLLGLQTMLRAAGIKTCGPGRTALLSLASAALVAFPVDGLSLAAYARGINSDWSIPTLLLMLHWARGNATGANLQDPRTHRSFWRFGALSAFLLYPAALGLSGFDPYALGFGSGYMLLALLTASLALIVRRNPLGVVLPVCVACWNLGFLESKNLWDYLIDPLFGVVSILMVGAELISTRSPKAARP
jgi:hypothetical protein